MQREVRQGLAPRQVQPSREGFIMSQHRRYPALRTASQPPEVALTGLRPASTPALVPRTPFLPRPMARDQQKGRGDLISGPQAIFWTQT
uniref:Uncharacterized protein n=1 Tax=Plectus sambesii TaxID=2011161 RepID=A0A914X5X7_9BILA